jgi:hypothetical protein
LTLPPPPPPIVVCASNQHHHHHDRGRQAPSATAPYAECCCYATHRQRCAGLLGMQQVQVQQQQAHLL